MPLVSLVYVSFAVHDMSDAELKDILEVSRRNNKYKRITGMLLYRDGFFLQALEGEKAIVDALYDKIAQDPRHRSVLKVYEDVVDHRTFGDWSMGFNKLDDETIAGVPGFTYYLDKPQANPDFLVDKPNRAVRLIQNFKNKTYF